MLYPKNGEKRLSAELFRDPTSEYRCTPFWAWNCDLDDDLLHEEIEHMKEMGMGGFHMHVRTGMSTKYLSDEFMAHIKGCVEKAKSEGMLAWLYDEDKWPSGFAGGYVTADPENRMKFLLFTPWTNAEAAAETTNDSRADGRRTGKGKLIACYDVRLDEKGCLAGYRRIDENDAAEGVKWYAYLETTGSSPWYNLQGYADTMNAKTVRRFIDITHERYYAELGGEFGTNVPAVFTDEPQMTKQTTLAHAIDRQDVILAYTPDFDETYMARYGTSFLDALPEVVWELPSGVSKARYNYHDHATERFVGAYCDQIGEWCAEHGILMTGHMMSEPTLASQTAAVGECMRAYRKFGLPGIDMLCDRREFTTAKQAASAAHQYGCPGVMSELYGVTNWDFDFRGHKLQGDWQAALGVSVRVPHLYWVSMHGESKRDYPASIGHQSAWYKEYPFIEDHFARVNCAMTRGKADIKIGVIHPVESYWLKCGPEDQTGALRKDMDRRFEEITEWLLYNTLDFDYICESTLPAQHVPGGKGFKVGEMEYDAVIVPSCVTLRSTTAEALRAFARSGGRVIFMGDVPEYIDAQKSDEGEKLAAECMRIGWNKSSLLAALADVRDIEVRAADGLPSDNIFAAMRDDNGLKELFLCHVNGGSRLKADRSESYRISIRGEWSPELLDTATGEIKPVRAEYAGGLTIIDWTCYPQDSLLLRLGKGRCAADADKLPAYAAEGAFAYLPDECRVTLTEPNAALVDMAEWRTDDGEWQPKDEMLRIGVMAKQALGMSTATVGGAQPWVLPKEKAEHTVSLRCEILSDVAYSGAYLALEDFDISEISFNGQPVEKADAGMYVDASIRKVKLPDIKPGVNILIVTKPFTVRDDIENMFILGDFSVNVKGRRIVIARKNDTLCIGDWTKQGLPFYGGAVTYHYEIENADRLRLGLFAAPCVTVDVDGKRMSNVSLAPYEADLSSLGAGKHAVDITVWASRVNTFGTFHLCDHTVTWFGPGAWRSEGADWTYDYRLTPSGLLTEPRIFVK